MTDHNDEHEDKGHCLADLVKCAVLIWSAGLLTVSYLNIFPKMSMDQTFVASLLTGSLASYGIERKNNGTGKKKPDVKVDSNVGIK